MAGLDESEVPLWTLCPRVGSLAACSISATKMPTIIIDVDPLALSLLSLFFLSAAERINNLSVNSNKKYEKKSKYEIEI